MKKLILFGAAVLAAGAIAWFAVLARPQPAGAQPAKGEKATLRAVVHVNFGDAERQFVRAPRERRVSLRVRATDAVLREAARVSRRSRDLHELTIDHEFGDMRVSGTLRVVGCSVSADLDGIMEASFECVAGPDFSWGLVAKVDVPELAVTGTGKRGMAP